MAHLHSSRLLTGEAPSSEHSESKTFQFTSIRRPNPKLDGLLFAANFPSAPGFFFLMLKRFHNWIIAKSNNAQGVDSVNHPWKLLIQFKSWKWKSIAIISATINCPIYLLFHDENINQKRECNHHLVWRRFFFLNPVKWKTKSEARRSRRCRRNEFSSDRRHIARWCLPDLKNHIVHGSERNRSENSAFHVLIVHKRVFRSLITQQPGTFQRSTIEWGSVSCRPTVESKHLHSLVKLSISRWNTEQLINLISGDDRKVVLARDDVNLSSEKRPRAMIANVYGDFIKSRRLKV